MTSTKFWPSIRVALVSALFCSAAQAVTLSATATDLQDAVSGQDLWRFDYSLAGPLPAGNGVTLTFSYLDFAGLAVVTAPAIDVDYSLLDTDAPATFDGLLTLIAKGDLTSAYTTSFSVSFTKLTPSALSSQSFGGFDELGDPILNGGGGISVTIVPPSPVPEPSNAALFVLGAFAVAGAQWRRSRAV